MPRSAIGKRVFSSHNIPVYSELGKKLLTSKDANKLVIAVRRVVRGESEHEKIELTERINNGLLMQTE